MASIGFEETYVTKGKSFLNSIFSLFKVTSDRIFRKNIVIVKNTQNRVYEKSKVNLILLY